MLLHPSSLLCCSQGMAPSVPCQGSVATDLRRSVRAITDENGAVSYAPFAEGWLQGESNWGRPVDVLVMPDGSLLVSDDQAGLIYRISY